MLGGDLGDRQPGGELLDGDGWPAHDAQLRAVDGSDFGICCENLWLGLS